MTRINRRSFLALTSTSLASLATIRSLAAEASAIPQDYGPQVKHRACWLDVCAPFLIQDPTIGLTSEIVLTADNFIGASGYADGADATEYEIYLYDSAGRLIGNKGAAKPLVVQAMQTTIIPIADLVGADVRFYGGMRIRLKPRTRIPSHSSDLFSSAFVRWKTNDSFTNVHANPDPLEWQRADSFFYSMPFPPLRDYQCLYSLFNPYAERSSGLVTLYDPFGTSLKELPYDLTPHSSVLVDLRMGEFVPDCQNYFLVKGHPKTQKVLLAGAEHGGTIAVTNKQGSVKNFGYLFIRQANGSRFSIEHPIHQQSYNPAPATVPFDSAGRLRAKNILYTPLVFHGKKIGGITLNSPYHAAVCIHDKRTQQNFAR